MKKKVIVHHMMQDVYVYYLTKPTGGNFDPDFCPDLTPAEMLCLGVFGGKYMTECRDEFPAAWYRTAKLCPDLPDPWLNCSGANASQPLQSAFNPAHTAGSVKMIETVIRQRADYS